MSSAKATHLGKLVNQNLPDISVGQETVKKSPFSVNQEESEIIPQTSFDYNKQADLSSFSLVHNILNNCR